jgi:hypothetical protein
MSASICARKVVKRAASAPSTGELSEVVTHLAFYSGWANAMAAAAVAKEVFAKRGVRADQLPAASGDLLPLDKAAEAQRASRVEQDFGSVAPGVVQYTTDVLFRDLWLRPVRVEEFGEGVGEGVREESAASKRALSRQAKGAAARRRAR